MAQGLLITGPERRRSWRVEEREQILSEAFAPGAVASLVARRHDVSTGLLYSWRKKALAQLDRTAFAQAAFLPAVVEEGRAACSASGKVMKPAKINTGFEVMVPLFCNTGDKIEIDTRTLEYKNRVL